MMQRTRTRVLRAAILVAIVGLFVLAWTQRGRYTPVDAGSPAPEFSGRTLDGGTFSVSAMRGKVVVLNVWATWCVPCRREMPALERLHQQLGPRGLQVVGVSTDTEDGELGPWGEKGGDVAAFVQEIGVTFTIVQNTNRSIEQSYLVTGLPTTFVIDKTGKIVKKALGGKAWDSPENIAYFTKLLAS